MVKVKEDLTGKIFGRLIVQYQAEDWITPTTQKHIPMWHCQCRCGNELNVRGADLKNGTTTSCGCFKRDIHIKPNKYDLSGEYGIGYNASDNREFYFDLEDYDKIKDRAWHIDDKLRKVVSREGHKGKQIALSRYLYGVKENEQILYRNNNYCDNRKENLMCRQTENIVTYKLNGEYGIGILNDENHTTFIFDKEDYELIKDYSWYEQQGYIKTVIRGKNIALHRLVMGVLDDDDRKPVDHINRNKLDDRKENLRIVTTAQNNKNRDRWRKDGTKVGVYKFRDKWESKIGINGECTRIGVYDTYEDAVKARIEAEEKYYGDI